MCHGIMYKTIRKEVKTMSIKEFRRRRTASRVTPAAIRAAMANNPEYIWAGWF